MPQSIRRPTMLAPRDEEASVDPFGSALSRAQAGTIVAIGRRRLSSIAGLRTGRNGAEKVGMGSQKLSTDTRVAAQSVSIGNGSK